MVTKFTSNKLLMIVVMFCLSFTSLPVSEATYSLNTVNSKSVASNPTKIPFEVALAYVGVNDISSSGRVGASLRKRGSTQYVQFYYRGDLNDLESKPLGVRFYIFDEIMGTDIVIGAASMTTSKDVSKNEKPSCVIDKLRKDKIQYICKVAFKPEANGIKPQKGIRVFAATYNSVGESARSNPIKLFPLMEQKAFLECIEKGVSDTKKDMISAFTGIFVDTGASWVTQAQSNLNLGLNIWEQGIVKSGITFVGSLQNRQDLKQAIEETLISSSLDSLNRLLEKNSIKVSGATAGAARKASLLGIFVGGALAGVEIYVAGQRGAIRLTDCETNSRLP